MRSIAWSLSFSPARDLERRTRKRINPFSVKKSWRPFLHISQASPSTRNYSLPFNGGPRIERAASAGFQRETLDSAYFLISIFNRGARLPLYPSKSSFQAELYVIYVRTPTSIVEGDRLGECGNDLLCDSGTKKILREGTGPERQRPTCRVEGVARILGSNFAGLLSSTHS